MGDANESTVKKAYELSGKVAQFTAFAPPQKELQNGGCLVSPVGKREIVDQIIAVSRDITKKKEKSNVYNY
jgi:hypothetical protein